MGPTDPLPSRTGRVVVVLLLAVGGAWYFDLLPGEAKDALEGARDAVESNLEEVRREVGGDDEDERPRRGSESKSKSKSKSTSASAPSEDGGQAREPARPKAETQGLPIPRVVVASKSGALLGSAYLVRGKVKNTGGAKATRVRVVVTFEGEGGALTEVEASCPRTLKAGKSARYEAAIAGEAARDVQSFRVKATFE